MKKQIVYKFMSLVLRFLMDIHRYSRMNTPLAGSPSSANLIQEAEETALECQALSHEE
jgi:hypothetical protein